MSLSIYLFLFVQGVCFTFAFQKFSRTTSLLLLTRVLRIVYLPARDIVFTGCIVYTVFYRCMTALVETSLERILNYTRQQQVDSRKIHRQFFVVFDAFNDFDDIFSFLPLIWLSFNFSQGAYIVFTSNDNIEMTSILLILSFVMENTCVFVLLWELERQQKTIRKILTEITFILVDKNISNQYPIHSLMFKISETRPTVFSLFYLDRSLIPSFLGSIVSFTALFFQLIPER
jgi:hypothetical protein